MIEPPTGRKVAVEKPNVTGTAARPEMRSLEAMENDT